MGLYDSTHEHQPGDLFAERPQLPYLLPLLVFVAFMLPGGMGEILGIDFGHLFGVNWKETWFHYHPAVYAVKTIVAAVLLWKLWKYFTPIRWSHLPLGVLVGVAGVPIWVLTEYASQAVGFSARPNLADPYVFYDPVKMIPDPTWRYAFYAIRVIGPTLVVPVMEELFFRDFLMRALIRGGRFQEVAVGTFSWLAILGSSLLFALNHIQKPSGFVYGLMMALLVVRTKSLGSCIVAHGVTNLLLYSAYCIPFGDWQFM